MNIFKYSIVFLTFTILSCNKGIEPETEPAGEEPGFGGTITFIGEWPDSINLTHIVLFKEALEDPTDFNAANLQYFSELIPIGTSVLEYNTLENSSFGTVEPREYGYLAVVQSTLTDISFLRKDWIVAGIYYVNGDTSKPGKLVIPENTFVENINITCDFNNPPPQPPGGK